jgi:hypothetical protein
MTKADRIRLLAIERCNPTEIAMAVQSPRRRVVDFLRHGRWQDSGDTIRRRRTNRLVATVRA